MHDVVYFGAGDLLAIGSAELGTTIVKGMDQFMGEGILDLCRTLYGILTNTDFLHKKKSYHHQIIY